MWHRLRTSISSNTVYKVSTREALLDTADACMAYQVIHRNIAELIANCTC